MSERATPETDDLDRELHNPRVLQDRYSEMMEHAQNMERERDEAREENKKFREALEWIAERYDDSKPMHSVAMDAYEMSCTARAALRKEKA